MRIACGLAAAAALAPLIAVVGYTIRRGIGAWGVDFFSHMPTPPGVPGGGILNAIVGSGVIDVMAAVVAIPVGVASGIVLAQANGHLANGIRFATDVLAGIPSITLGIFAYAVVVTTMRQFSALSASCALAMLMAPIVMRTSESALRGVPGELLDAGLALGSRRRTVIWRVLVRTALPGITTGAILALARAVGETAPLLFTTIGSQFLTFSPLRPMSAMPLVAYLDGVQEYPDLQATAWGTALVLLVLALVLSILGRALARRFTHPTDSAGRTQSRLRTILESRAALSGSNA